MTSIPLEALKQHITILRKSLAEFCAMKKEMMQKILAQGEFTFPPPVLNIAEKELGETKREYASEDYLMAG